MKKAFTLAEILIVLTIIGVMAVMTIPSLMQNSNSQQKITLFKKGFNAVSNAYATEFAVKSPPKNSDKVEKEKMWDALNNQLNVKYYVNTNTGKKMYTLEEAKAVGYQLRTIVTEDGIGYAVSAEGEGDCKTKEEINSITDMPDIVACMTIAVILDGKYEYSKQKYCNYGNYAGYKSTLNNLKCDTLWFPVSKNGITTGNPDCTIAGRIMSDNITYDASKCTEENP